MPPNLNLISISTLETIRSVFKVSIGETQYVDLEGQNWFLIDAVSADGMEQWVAKGPTYYETVVALAGLIGMELEDG